MATRRVPFEGATSAVIFVQLLEHAPEPIRNWNESIPKELERVVLRLMMKDKRERLQSAKELQAALERVEGKKARGGWLKKSSTPIVPLVRAQDPVARERRPAKKSSGARDAAKVEGDSRSGGLLIRPLERAAIAAESGVIDHVQTEAAVADFTTTVEAKPAGSSSSSARRTALARSRTGVTQFEYGVDFEVAPPEVAESKTDRPAASRLQHSPGRRSARLAIVVVLLVLAAGGVFQLVRGGWLRPAVLGPSDSLLLTVIQNRTGDSALDGSVLVGLEIELRQSGLLNVRGVETYDAGLRQIAGDGVGAMVVPARTAAEKTGARAYLYGEIKRAGPAYVINVDVLNTQSNDKLASVTEVASTRERIPAAIDRIAAEVRSEMGEDSASIADGVPLEREATSNLEALHDYAIAENALQQGHIADGLTWLRRAAGLDPRFVQAQMRLAWLYGAEKAEVVSANAAGEALSRDADDKVKLLAEFCFEMNASGDYGKAATTIRQYTERYPHDVEGMVGLARVLHAQGHLVEALLAAEQAYGDNPYAAAAYDEAERAMIGLDRYDEALQLERQARRLGVERSGNAVAAAYLAGKQDVFAEEIGAGREGLRSYAQLNEEALYLDNSGQMAASAALLKKTAATFSQSPEMASARAYLLAQSALDLALAGRCSEAKELTSEMDDLPHGPMAGFHAGVAVGLCGDRAATEATILWLRQGFPQSTAVLLRYIPELEAVAALTEKNAAKALEVLATIAPYEDRSLAPYLRGVAHGAGEQPSLAVADFQAVLEHRGMDFASGSNVYPMAEIGLARASEAAGDKAVSVAAYGRFAALWVEDDKARSSLSKEASKGR
jgi:serine/threonine-protein kinase